MVRIVAQAFHLDAKAWTGAPLNSALPPHRCQSARWSHAWRGCRACRPLASLQRLHTLRCQVPYALEGLVRREISTHPAAQLLSVEHGAALVALQWSLPEDAAAALQEHIHNACQGRASWVEPER